MKIFFEIALAFGTLLIYPSLSLASFIFITPIITCIQFKKLNQTLWISIFFTLIQEAALYPSSLSSGSSLLLPFMTTLAIYATYIVSQRISCGFWLLSTFFLLFISVCGAIIQKGPSYFFFEMLFFSSILHLIHSFLSWSFFMLHKRLRKNF